MNLQPPVEALRSLTAFSEALEVALPLIAGLAVFAVLAAALGLLGLFLTEGRATHQRPATLPELRVPRTFAPAGWLRGRSAKLVKHA